MEKVTRTIVGLLLSIGLLYGVCWGIDLNKKINFANDISRVGATNVEITSDGVRYTTGAGEQFYVRSEKGNYYHKGFTR